jgi:cytochrome c peroxidase
MRCRFHAAIAPLVNEEQIPVKPTSLLVACSLLLFSTVLIRAGGQSQDQGRGRRPDPLAAARGFKAFTDHHLEGLGGNGRACSDCHMPTDRFQLSPESVETRYQLLQLRRQEDPDADDPLFRAIDADDFRVNGENAADFSNLRENGLIRITFPLPANIRLIDPVTNAPSAETFVDVWRSVPTVNDVALTGPDVINPWFRGPNVFGGYQLDGRAATLQEQARGALINHAKIQGEPPQRMLDELAAFEMVQFTNPRVRALSEAVSEGADTLPDPDLPLNDLEQQGKQVFTRACAQCHGGASQSNPALPRVRFHDIRSECPRPVDPQGRYAFAACEPRLARNVRTYQIRLANGTTARRTTSDPGRALLTGFAGGPAGTDDWNKFDVPGLRGISRTAPYFHNNSAATLEEVVDHYIEFFKFVEVQFPPPAVPPPIVTTDGIHFDRRPLPEERAALLAYLRRM